MPLFVWFSFTMQICNKKTCSLTQQLISCLCLVTFLHEILGLGLCLGVWNSLFYWHWNAWKSCCTHTTVLWSCCSLIFCPSICFQKHQKFLSSSLPDWPPVMIFQSKGFEHHLPAPLLPLMWVSSDLPKSALETLLFAACSYSQDLGQGYKSFKPFPTTEVNTYSLQCWLLWQR